MEKTNGYKNRRLPDPSNINNGLGAAEVIRKECFPSDGKPLSEHTRPTNTDYTMIEQDGNSADASES